MWQIGPQPDQTTYQEVLFLCGQFSQKEWAIYLLADALRNGLRLRKYDFNSAIWSCQAGGHWDSARWLLGQMRLEAVEPGATSYSMVMQACYRGTEAEMALEVLDSLRVAGVEPSRRVFNHALFACDVGKRWLDALSLLREARQSRLHLVPGARSAVVSACVKSGRWEEAQVLVRREGLKRAPAMKGATLNSMVLAYKRAQLWDQATSLLAEMLRSPSTSWGTSWMC